MNLQNAVLGVGVAIAIVLGVLAINKSPQTNQPTQPEQFGNASSLAAYNGCVDYGGTYHCVMSQPLAAASTTCSFAPGRTIGTSTLVRATIYIDKAAGGTQDVEFGKSASIDATTTSLGIETAITGDRFSLQASTTPVNGGDFTALSKYTFGPSDMLNIKTGSTSVSSSFKGRCDATFIKS